MKKSIVKSFLMIVAVFLSFSFLPVLNTSANEEPIAEEVPAEEPTTVATGTSISLTPTSKILQIASNSIYDESFTVNNDGDAPIQVEIYAAPYSYVYSSEEDLYKLGFNNENNFTQLSRWITFRNAAGEYAEKATFSIDPHTAFEVAFRITTPDNIPNGGQYAVVFVHTLSSAVATNGIRTEASPGIVIYGRSTEGETITAAEISDPNIELKSVDGKEGIVATAKVKNTGNVDFMAIGNLKVEPIIGFSSYESPATNGRLSIIPEAELIVSDAWTELPSFGLYKATFSVTVGDETETIERIIFRISPIMIVISIILLTIIVVSVIMGIRKRKERRSRLSI